MSWPLKLVDEPGTNIGDCWYAPSMVEEYKNYYLKFLSIEYMTQWFDKRAPIIIWLPPGLGFCIDEGYHDHNRWNEHGWTVTGELPNITVHPSINCVGIYHGWIRDGILTDDCEGRKF